MAAAHVAPLITPDYFSVDPGDWPAPHAEESAIAELERRIDRALDAGTAAAIAAADAAIALLDSLAGDADMEADEEREDDELLVPDYGIDQSEPIGWRDGRATARALRALGGLDAQTHQRQRSDPDAPKATASCEITSESRRARASAAAIIGSGVPPRR
jgi:hypothetical protein